MGRGWGSGGSGKGRSERIREHMTGKEVLGWSTAAVFPGRWCPVRGPLASGERRRFVGSSQHGCPDLTVAAFFSIFQVWKLGWSPKPGGDFGTAFPEIPVEFLQEKEVFKEFIYRINTLGSVDFAFGNVRPQGAFA